MRVPVSVFDLYLAATLRPAVTLLREEAANRLTQVFKQLADEGMLFAKDGTPIPADAIRYEREVRDLEVPYESLASARKAGLPLDDDTLERALIAQRNASPEVAPELIEAPVAPSDGAESPAELVP